MISRTRPIEMIFRVSHFLFLACKNKSPLVIESCCWRLKSERIREAGLVHSSAAPQTHQGSPLFTPLLCSLGRHGIRVQAKPYHLLTLTHRHQPNRARAPISTLGRALFVMSLSKPLAPELISGATTLPQRIFSKVITTFLPLVGERWTWAIMHVIYHETVWSLYVYPLLLAEKYGWMEKWRIQKGKYPDPELVKRMYKDVAFGKLMSPLVIAFVMYPLFKFGGADLAQAIRKYPDWPEFLKGIAICFVGEDFFFYCEFRSEGWERSPGGCVGARTIGSCEEG